MKKIEICLMALVLLLSFALGGSAFAAEKSIKVAMIQWRGETEACRGFRARLKELGYSVKYTVLNAGQSRKKLGGLLREKLLPNLGRYDYVYSYGTTASKMTKTILNNKVPHLFSNVSAPLKSKIVKNMNSTGENISGTTNRIPVSVQIKTAAKIIKFKIIGILFNPREKNSMLMRKELYQEAKSNKFEIVDLRSPPAKGMLENNLQKLIESPGMVDAVFIPLDSYMITKAKVVGARLRAAKVRSIGAQKKYIQNGVLIGIVPDYYNLGKKVAGILRRHANGEKLQNIPVQKVDEPTIMINRATAKSLNVQIPPEFRGKVVFVD